MHLLHRYTPLHVALTHPRRFILPVLAPRLLQQRFALMSTSSDRPQYVLPPLRMDTLDKSKISLRIPITAVRIEAGKVKEVRSHPCMKGQTLSVRKTLAVVNDPEPGFKQLRLRSDVEVPADVRSFLEAEGKGFVKDELELGYDHWSTSEVLASILPDTYDDVPSSFTQTGHIGHVNLRDEWLPYKNLIGQVILDKNPQLRTIVNKLNNIHAEYRYFDMEVIAGEDSEDIFISTVNESSCSFTLNFKTVYWNSRLGHEHERLVDLFQPGEVVADVMGGVGPFAVPAAKKGCRVLGNDLNPEGVKWMEVNRVNNKVESALRITNLDGRDFIRQTPLNVWSDPFPPIQLPKTRKQRDREARVARHARERQAQSGEASQTPASSSIPTTTTSNPTTLLDNLHIDQPSTTSASPSTPVLAHEEPSGAEIEPQQVDHFVMNLPDSALTFLDAYRGAYVALSNHVKATAGAGAGAAAGTGAGIGAGTSAELKMPLIHVYCFTRELDPVRAREDICKRASEYLEHAITQDTPDFNLHLVRSVAPNKDMYCLTFRLPREVALADV